ncbi:MULTISPECIES: OmpA family protein [unclassified Photobacterium]|uniref:OmpA family protein n=1 Tax=unclassified Photobacterium TaxID=2628852 RepID=UPI000D16FCEF|nr:MULTISPECIES: OmpA family protein [unclassified Photobacterium]PSV27722.1 hypothetical protein C9J42_05000 [Photobacterium sp. GB-56]PSV31371.1 hypothetical protein C9J40_07920 [Photobacterium sp. GB-72]PSV35068.1 hypothetical protein C9J44_13785 [Photobacterium sp. GB-27]PSV38573.1 hypothetical protein C9J38_08855 [Photobacterium sp. GB-210]PSV45918.1 hypothetical protein C9J46_05235 [Photobacterium sp. GB-36]
MKKLLFLSVLSSFLLIQSGCVKEEEIFVDYGDLSQLDSDLYSVYYEWPSVINFDFDDFQLDYGDKLKLDKVAQTLLSNIELKVALIGSADPEGSKNYNNKLSQNRALSVARYLIDSGVMRTRIVVTSSGVSNKYLKTNDRDANFVNRRVQILLLGTDSNPVEMMYEVKQSD